MILSVQELLYMNEFLDKKQIFGITEICVNDVKNSVSQNTLFKSLRKKKILNEYNQFTQVGVNLLSHISEYKNANVYIKLNHIRSALVPNDCIIILFECSKNFCFSKLSRGDFLFGLLKEFSVLRRDHISNNTIKKQLTYTQWHKKELLLKKEFPNSIFYQKFIRSRLSEAKIYYWNQQEIYRYDILRKECRNCSSSDMRYDFISAIDSTEKKQRL